MIKMSENIFRTVHNAENPFAQVHKYLINDKSISFKAKGIMLYLLSKPDDWQVYETDIRNHATDGQTSVSSGIEELMEAKYLERSRIRNEKGHFKGYEYKVYEVPYDSKLTESGFSQIGKSKNGKAQTTNNNITNNNLTNTFEQVVSKLIANADEGIDIRSATNNINYFIDKLDKTVRYDFDTWLDIFNRIDRVYIEDELIEIDQNLIDTYFNRIDNPNLNHFTSPQVLKITYYNGEY
jgi:hypothetical protein